MKIGCDACGARYSIADEKIAGRTFKIRCKKCSGVVVVRGDMIVAAADATAPEGPWHALVHGEAQGPMSAAQVASMLEDGLLDPESLVWREGFEAWRPLRDVHELAPSPWASDRTTPATPALVRAARNAPDAAFADTMVAPKPAAASVAFAEEAPKAASLTAARNEQSVLFSIKNLHALATGARPPSAPPAAATARTEGSGLIDIRALSTTVSTSPAAAGRNESSDVEGLLAIGSGPALGSPLALLPVASEPRRGWMVGALAAAGGLAVALAVVAVVLALQRPGEASADGAGGDIVAGGPGGDGAGDSLGSDGNGAARDGQGGALEARDDDAARDGNGDGPDAIEPDGTDPAGTDARDARTADGRDARDARNARDDTAGDTRDARNARDDAARDTRNTRNDTTRDAPDPRDARNARDDATAPRTDDRTAHNDALGDLIDRALEGDRDTPDRSAQQPTPPRTSLPETPSRDAVRAALTGVSGAVRACGQGQHGVAMVNVTFRGASGAATSATVSGDFAGTPVGSCIAQAVRSARVPAFSQPTFRAQFPYRI
jgi:predicted Zn finger-like uncharacterized protein